MKTLVRTAGRKLHIRIILKYVLPCLLIAAVLYFLLGTILPLLRHKSVGEDFRASFNAAECLSETVGSERVRCLNDNTEALTWRLRLIDSAQEELLFSSFDFRDDESGQDVLSALLNAAERGVQVRVVVDWLTNFTDLAHSAYFRALVSNPNVEMKVYNPINLLKPWKLQIRLHDKYIVADDFAYLLGGRNTNDLFLGNYSEKQNYDRDLLVYESAESENGSLGKLKTYF